MKKPLFSFPPLKGGKPAPAKPAPKAAPKPSKRLEVPKTGGRVGGSLPPEQPKAPEAAPVVERTLPLRAQTTGQGLPPTAPNRCPELKVSNGKVTGLEMFKYEGDDVWHSTAAEAGRVWLVKYRAYFPEAAKLLAARMKSTPAGEDLLS